LPIQTEWPAFGTSVESDDDVVVLGQPVHQLTLALVTELETDNRSFCYPRATLMFPIRLVI
jgi:hypothetical protein